MRIRIPLVVSSEMGWCANHDSFQSEPDWAAMEDSIPRSNWAALRLTLVERAEAPALARLWVTVDVPVPDAPPEFEGEVEGEG